MILVSGTKRSGTSMWMQALAAAGLPTIGTPFAAHWEASIREANPRGFHESILRQGIFYATNPHPKTGRWMHPDAVRRHVVKVFVPGLVRTDYAYIDHVVGTMRDWRCYGGSLTRLTGMEDAWIATQPDGDTRLANARRNRTVLPHPVEWFLENHELIRDVAVRGYPVNLCTYARVLRDPERELGAVLRWLGEGDVAAAVAAIEPSLTTQDPVEGDLGMDPAHAEVFDTLYATIDRNEPLRGPLIDELNRIRDALVERYGELSPDRSREDELA